jgi:hypothetical protein
MEGEGTAHNCIGSSESVTKQCLDNEEGDVRRKWDVGNRKTKHGLWVSLSLSLSLSLVGQSLAKRVVFISIKFVLEKCSHSFLFLPKPTLFDSHMMKSHNS